MSKNETSSSSPSTLAIFGWMTVMLTIIGAAALLRQEQAEMHAQANALVRLQATEIIRLQTQIADLGKEVAAIPASRPDDGVAAALKDTNTQLTGIAQQLDALEANAKKPQPAAAAPTPAAATASSRVLVALQTKLLQGQPYGTELDAVAASPAAAHETDALGTLKTLAASGAPTDLTLRANFNAILDKTSQTANPVPSSSWLHRVNGHLGGLVTIKPRTAAAADAYISLRDLPGDTSIAALTEKTNALPADQRAPFDSWLKDVEARDKALAAFNALESRLLPAS